MGNNLIIPISKDYNGSQSSSLQFCKSTLLSLPIDTRKSFIKKRIYGKHLKKNCHFKLRIDVTHCILNIYSIFQYYWDHQKYLCCEAFIQMKSREDN